MPPGPHLATAQDYADFFAGLTADERQILEQADIPLAQPDDGPIHGAGAIPVRPEDGLSSFKKNGSPRVPDPLCESHFSVDDNDHPSEIRADLAEAARRVFLWLLAGLPPEKLFSKPSIIANRAAILARALHLDGFDNLTLADIGRLANLTRAAMSKVATSFRDFLGSKYIVAPSDRNHTRAKARHTAKRAWAKRKLEGR